MAKWSWRVLPVEIRVRGSDDGEFANQGPVAVHQIPADKDRIKNWKTKTGLKYVKDMDGAS